MSHACVRPHPEVPRRSDLMRLAEEVCLAEGINIPSIQFGHNSIAKCLDDRIRIPSPEWIHEHHGLDDPVNGYHPAAVAEIYRMTALHELAHWIELEHEGETRHSPFMYATFFRLIKAYGFDLAFALEHEQSYKPRASMQGWRLYQQWLAEDQEQAA